MDYQHSQSSPADLPSSSTPLSENEYETDNASHDQGPQPREMLAHKLSRRHFMVSTGATGAGLALVPLVGHAAEALASQAAVGRVSLRIIQFTVNGKPTSLTVDPRLTLLDALRDRLRLTGTKKGCDHGQCGACTVHVNGRRVNACLTLAATVDGARVTTIEGLAGSGGLHPMQAAFIEHDGFQCGYCTSGQIMSAVSVLAEGHARTDDEIREAMAGNLCRCGAYPGILAAIKSVAGKQS